MEKTAFSEGLFGKKQNISLIKKVLANNCVGRCVLSASGYCI